MEGGAVGHNFERDHPCQVCFNLVQRFQRRRFKCDLLSKYDNLHNRYKSAERKISQKSPEYMFNYSLPCTCSSSKNLSSFWFILKQQWTIEEISIFSNSSHLEWRAGMSDTILKGTHQRTITARFVLIWFNYFRGEDLNVIFYQNMPNLHNRYKSAERKISQKKPGIYVKLLIVMYM
jgi:hypothetical protein